MHMTQSFVQALSVVLSIVRNGTRFINTCRFAARATHTFVPMPFAELAAQVVHRPWTVYAFGRGSTTAGVTISAPNAMGISSDAEAEAEAEEAEAAF